MVVAVCATGPRAAGGVRKPAKRAARPVSATQSAYQGVIRGVKVTMPNRSPSIAAVRIAASAMPMTGRSNSSRAARRPGSPKAAMTTASTESASAAIISSATAPATCASARDEM
jgi:hypothetical protein